MPDSTQTEDLYCLTCGYNLRGLPGDPRRCPECGDESTVKDMRIPAESIHKQVEKLETWPVLMVGCFVFCLSGWLLLYEFIRSFRYGHETAVHFSIPPAVLSALIGWIVCFVKFRANVESNSPWIRAIIMMHVSGFLILYCVLFFFFPRAADLAGFSSMEDGLRICAMVFWIPGLVFYLSARRYLKAVLRIKTSQLARDEMQRRNNPRNEMND